MQQPLNLHALVRALIITAVVSVTAPVFAAAAPIVFASWGGTTQSAQQKDWAAPFTQASGIQVLMDGPEGTSKNINLYQFYRKYEVGSSITFDLKDTSQAPDPNLKEGPPIDCKDPKNKTAPQCKQ